ncbi:MAG: putative DNA binding domain-containing protein [Endomicrobium sp.]|uniref:RNA-binding domain-containing protein n=1 Tax=Candidatus Endomicrobiellum cubanum TaxID=3242325 RepID=UPI002818D89D|nr:putative DNA binding domain-containing protein [Endomicrobium sp.]
MNLETNRIEYKEKLTEALEKEAVAFLNSKGGDIYIGVRNDGSILGVSNPDEIQLKIKDRLKDRLKDNIRPSIMGMFDIFTQVKDGKTIIVVNLASGAETPYYIKQKGRSESGCFIRVGSASQPMTEEMINKLMSKRHPMSLENIPARMQDLTFEQLKIYYAEKGKQLNEHFAENLKLLTANAKYNQIAYMFADKNRISIRLAQWTGKDRTLKSFEKEEYGDQCLLTALNKVQIRLDVANITQSKKQGLKPRLDKKYVDKNALREAIINAFVHNDYSREDTPIFEIFEDRFEITTYGNIFELMSEEEFFTGRSTPRNPGIMRIFQDLELVEHLGSGIPYIVGLYGRKAFQITQSGLRLSLRFDKNIDKESIKKTDIKSDQKSDQKVLEIVSKKPYITIQELSEAIGLTYAGAKKNMTKLKKQRKIRRVGPDKGGRWEVIEKNK